MKKEGFVSLVGWLVLCGVFVQTYDPFGKAEALVTEEWIARYNGPGNFRDGANVVVDGSGNVYVTGASWSANNADYATIKYSSSGTQLWVARYNGPGDGNDGASAIAVDLSGNVYVTGGSDGDPDPGVTNFDYATIKYSSSGTQLWAARYNGPGNGYDSAIDIAVDPLGNVYVTGASRHSTTNDDYATIKYSSSGSELWVARYNYTQVNGYENATALDLDGSSFVYVTGWSDGANYTDYATIKYSSSNGSELWAKRYNGPADGWDQAYDIVVRSYIYVTGYSDGIGTVSDYVTIAYGSNGVAIYLDRYNGTANAYDYANALAVDLSGNVYVTGESQGSGFYLEYATIKYSGSLSPIWVTRYNGSVNGDDKAYSIDVDGPGNVYVTGLSRGSTTNDDYATIKYSVSGSELWVMRYNGPGNNDDEAYDIVVDDTDIYVTGKSLGSGTDYDYATIKYSDPGTGVTEEECRIQLTDGSSFFISPNPYWNLTTIQGRGEFRIYDLMGRLRGTIKQGPFGQNLESGVYFVRQGERMIKLVKIK